MTNIVLLMKKMTEKMFGFWRRPKRAFWAMENSFNDACIAWWELYREKEAVKLCSASAAENFSLLESFGRAIKFWEENWKIDGDSG